MKVRWKCWFARYEDAVILDGVKEGSVRVRLERVAVLGLHNPPSYPPVAHVPIELIPEEYRVMGTELTVEVTMGKLPDKHLRREGPTADGVGFADAFETDPDDTALNEAFGI